MGNPTQFLRLRDSKQPLVTRAQDSVNGTLGPLAERVGNTPIMGAPLPVWVRPDQLLAGYSQTAAPQPVVAFHIDALGYVHIKTGLTHAAGCAAGTIAFAMPLAYWPTETMTLAAFDQNGINSAVNISILGEFSNLAALAPGDEIRGYLVYRPGS